MARSVGKEQAGILGTDRIFPSLVCGNASAHLEKRGKMAEAAETGAAATRRVTASVTPYQVSALQLLVTEQARKMEAQEKALNSIVAARRTEEAEEARVKQQLESLQASFDRLQTGSHGGGTGGRGGGAGGFRVPISEMEMDQCPAATKDQSMREWTTLAKRWARSLPVALMEGEGRYRVHTAVAAGLNGKPRVKTAWNRVLEPHEKRFDDDQEAFPPLGDLLTELKGNVAEEEKIVAQEEFKFRDLRTGELYSEYKRALFSLAGVGYDEYSESQLSAKVLDRFLLGCGEAGPSVRLQAPKSLEEAIIKAIAFDNEKTRSEKTTVYALGNNYKSRGNNNNNNNNNNRPFNGNCFKCGKRGHKFNDCRVTNNNNNNESGNNNNNNQQRPAPRCFVCNQEGHQDFACPNRPGQ